MVALFPIARGLGVAMIAAGLALAGCERKPQASSVPSATPVAINPPALPRPPPALGRAEVLEALDAAASAYAGGAAGPAGDVAGRRFTVRQAFGCNMPDPARPGENDGHARLIRNASGDTLELNLQPADWSRAPVIADGAGLWEAVEGFWLPWPWLRVEGCPAAAPVTPPLPTQPATGGAAKASSPTAHAGAAAPETAAPPLLAETAGLAAVFEHGSSRLLRRDGRAYRHLIRGEAPLQPFPGGYRLVLEGRFAAFPDGRSIRCTASTPLTRPTCVAAAEIDRIAFEDAAGGVLSEWRPG